MNEPIHFAPPQDAAERDVVLKEIGALHARLASEAQADADERFKRLVREAVFADPVGAAVLLYGDRAAQAVNPHAPRLTLALDAIHDAACCAAPVGGHEAHDMGARPGPLPTLRRASDRPAPPPVPFLGRRKHDVQYGVAVPSVPRRGARAAVAYLVDRCRRAYWRLVLLAVNLGWR